MNISITKFCQLHNLPKTTVYNRAKELGIDTSAGLTDDAVSALKREFDVLEPEPEQPKVTVESGNHHLVVATPQLPTTYTLESLRASELQTFDDPLAIALSFVESADLLIEAMDTDIDTRKEQIRKTQEAKELVDQKALQLKVKAQVYKQKAALANAIASAETEALQDSLAFLQQLGKPTAPQS